MDIMKEILENTIESLYNGEININKKFPTFEEYSILQKESNELLQEIENKLDDKGKEILNEFTERKSRMMSIECKEKFIDGYKLACKLIIAGIK